MTMPSLIWGSPHWMTGALVLLGVAAATILWSYARAGTKRPVKIAAATLKALGFTALAISLLDPLLTGTRPLRGANAFVILADNSQSLRIRDDNTTGTRGEWLRDVLRQEAPWRTRLGQDFDVRGYVFDTHLRGVDGFDALTFDGTGTSLTASLGALSKRFRGLPLAGVLLFTDGNRTDVGDVDWSGLPPIYPVVPPSGGVAKDVGVSQISISQTNFESAPAVIRADVLAVGFPGKPIVAIVADETGKEVRTPADACDRRRQTAQLSIPVSPRTERRELLSSPCVRRLRREEGRASRRQRRDNQRADARQQQPAGCHRSRGWAVPGALRERAPGLGVQIPAPRARGRRPARARRPGPDRTSPAEVRLSQLNAPSRPARCSTGSIIPTRKRPSGPTSRS